MTNEEIVAQIEQIQNDATAATSKAVKEALNVPPGNIPEDVKHVLLGVLAQLQALLQQP